MDRSSRRPSRDHEVHRAVIIEIGGDHASSGGRETKRRLRGHIRERAVPIVAPENIVPRRVGRSRILRRRDVEIQVAVMVVVHKRHSHAAFFPANAHCSRHIFKLAVAFVMEKLHSIAQANCQIGLTVIIKIPSGTTHTAAHNLKSSFFCLVLKPAISEIVQQSAGSLHHTAH